MSGNSLPPGRYVVVDTLDCRRLSNARLRCPSVLGRVYEVTGPALKCACCVTLSTTFNLYGRHAPRGVVLRAENLAPLRDPDDHAVPAEREREVAA